MRREAPCPPEGRGDTPPQAVAVPPKNRPPPGAVSSWAVVAPSLQDLKKIHVQYICFFSLLLIILVFLFGSATPSALI